MTVMGEVTGKEGTITIDGKAFALAEFTVKFERTIATYKPVGEYSEFNVGTTVKVTGELKRMMIDGSMNARLLGGDADGSGNISAIGAVRMFDLVGKLTNADSSHNTIYLSNCIPTTNDFAFSDADTIVEEPIAFIVQNPKSDVSGNFTI